MLTFCKQRGVRNKRMLNILDDLPAFSIQNRSNLLQKKIEIIQKKSQRDDKYIQYLISRHPDLLMKSWGSFVAKIHYFERNLNRPLLHEKTFPLILYQNYGKVIRPRGDILINRRIRDFDFKDAFLCSDKEFCERYKVSLEEINK